MPRTLQEILDHADELAERFEKLAPTTDGVDAAPLRAVSKAVVARANADRELAAAVAAARSAGFSWALIGGMLGTSGEAARQRYGALHAAADPLA